MHSDDYIEEIFYMKDDLSAMETDHSKKNSRGPRCQYSYNSRLVYATDT